MKIVFDFRYVHPKTSTKTGKLNAVLAVWVAMFVLLGRIRSQPRSQGPLSSYLEKVVALQLCPVWQICLTPFDSRLNTDIAEYLSRLAPRKGFDFEMRKPFETSSSLWWVWLATRWYALRAPSSWNSPPLPGILWFHFLLPRMHVRFLGQCNIFYQLGDIFFHVLVKCLLPGEDSFALWSSYEACLV